MFDWFSCFFTPACPLASGCWPLENGARTLSRRPMMSGNCCIHVPFWDVLSTNPSHLLLSLPGPIHGLDSFCGSFCGGFLCCYFQWACLATAGCEWPRLRQKIHISLVTFCGFWWRSTDRFWLVRCMCAIVSGVAAMPWHQGFTVISLLQRSKQLFKLIGWYSRAEFPSIVWKQYGTSKASYVFLFPHVDAFVEHHIHSLYSLCCVNRVNRFFLHGAPLQKLCLNCALHPLPRVRVIFKRCISDPSMIWMVLWRRRLSTLVHDCRSGGFVCQLWQLDRQLDLVFIW